MSLKMEVVFYECWCEPAVYLKEVLRAARSISDDLFNHKESVC